VSDLHIDPRHFWAGAGADDPVPWLPGHGPHPDEAAFGGNVYKVDTSGHSNYWDARSESLANQASIIMGRYDDVTLDHGKAP
jgi:hypothetical protein